ncbi:MAG TPA: hypothetical protein PLA50_14255 [Bacteroidia bacterium]|nr:hypothetical protein [Bacteroidia bacterium]
MSKRRHAEEFEIPFVALMDTMTNVVGVLIIVLVLVGISVASAVKKILTDLPPVTQEQLEELQKIMAQKTEVKDPKELSEQIAALEVELRKSVDELTTLDTTATGLSLANIPDLEQQIAGKKKERDTKRTENEKLLAELDKLKATLDQTPIVAAAPGTVVRLPNPRPYPEKPVETKIIVAKEGVLFLKDDDFLRPIAEKLNQRRSQLVYGKDADPTPFIPMMEKILGSKDAAKTAWPTLAPLLGTYQMDVLAKGWKTLSDGGLAPTTDLLSMIGSVSLVSRKPLPTVAAATIAAIKGDYAPWIALDPSTDPLKPTVKAEAKGNKVAFTWGSKTEEVSADERGILRYLKTLSDMDNFKDAVKSRTIYDAQKMVAFLNSSAVTGSLPNTFGTEAKIRPGSTLLQVALTPKSGETAEKMKQPGSAYIRTLRNIKDDPNGVAFFQVVTDAIPTYLQAREMADQVGVPATWDFRGNLDVAMNIPNFEVQRFTEAAPARPATPGTTIAPPKRTLD